MVCSLNAADSRGRGQVNVRSPRVDSHRDMCDGSLPGRAAARSSTASRAKIQIEDSAVGWGYLQGTQLTRSTSAPKQLYSPSNSLEHLRAPQDTQTNTQNLDTTDYFWLMRSRGTLLSCVSTSIFQFLGFSISAFKGEDNQLVAA